MKTTLNEIKRYNPCASGWKTLLRSLGKSNADNEPLELMCILKSNGIKDAVWTLRCFEYRNYCLFLADVAESVLHIYESRFDSSSPKSCIQAIRDYHCGLIDRGLLRKKADAAHAAADAAYAAAHAAAYAAAYAAYAAAYAAADAAADAATYAAADAAYAAYAAADAATYAAADAAYAAYAAADAAKWREIEQLFIKHFGDE